MTVRSKMSPGYTAGRGDKGAELYFQVVSEGNDEMKSISENAIYGRSSPSGSFDVAGEFPVEQFMSRDGQIQEEYYVDLCAPGDETTGHVFKARARKVYQSAAAVNSMSEAIVNFRYVIVEPNLGGTYRIGCANPPASSWMIDHDEVVIVVSVAMGRKSDREIQLRGELLEEDVASILGYNKFDTSEEAIKRVMLWTKANRFRFWRAIGNRDDMPPEWDALGIIEAAVAKLTFKSTPAA